MVRSLSKEDRTPHASVVVSPGKCLGPLTKLLSSTPMMGDFELELIGPER